MRSVLGKYELQARSINLQKKEQDQYFSSMDRTSWFKEGFMIMALFQIFWQHGTFISVKRARATKAKILLFLRHFHRSPAKCLVRQRGKRLYTERQNISFCISFQEHKSMH